MATNRLQSSTPQCVWSTWEWWWWWSLLLQQCHVIHQALMMVIRNQFGTTVESCQSIMFNLIHMQKEKKRFTLFGKLPQIDWNFCPQKWAVWYHWLTATFRFSKTRQNGTFWVFFIYFTQNVNVAGFVGNVEWDFWVIFKHREVEKILYFKKPRVVGSENKRSKLGFSSPQKYN